MRRAYAHWTLPSSAAGCFTVPIIDGLLHATFSVRFRGWNPGVVTGVGVIHLKRAGRSEVSRASTPV